jgi:hypothetical protein
MDFIRGTSRNQVMLFPESVEDYITADNPVYSPRHTNS